MDYLLLNGRIELYPEGHSKRHWLTCHYIMRDKIREVNQLWNSNSTTLKRFSGAPLRR
jgi:hypothetical protein